MGDVPYDREAICDTCGEAGAYDFLGDCLCPECTKKYLVDEEDEQ